MAARAERAHDAIQIADKAAKLYPFLGNEVAAAVLTEDERTIAHAAHHIGDLMAGLAILAAIAGCDTDEIDKVMRGYFEGNDA